MVRAVHTLSPVMANVRAIAPGRPGPPREVDDLAASGERPVASGRTSYVGPTPSLPPLAIHEAPFGVTLAATSRGHLEAWFRAAVGERGLCPRLLVFAGAATLNRAFDDDDLRAVLRSADVVLGEGAALSVYGAFARSCVRDTPAELVRVLLAGAGPVRVFLQGGGPGRAEAAARALASIPGVLVVGAASAREGASVLEAINEACADVVLVDPLRSRALRGVEEARLLLDVGVVVAAEGLFDDLVGAPRAPWLDRVLEAVHEGPRFILRALAHALRPRRELEG